MQDSVVFQFLLALEKILYSQVLPWLSPSFRSIWLCRCGVIDPARIYDLMGEILSALNRFSLGLCAFLYIKVGLQMPFHPWH